MLPNTRYAKSGNVHVAYQVFGKGDIDLAFFPGFVSNIVGDERTLATVLLTDIVGSTKHAEAMGDRRWPDLLDAHNAIFRRELTRFRGAEVKTTGDGFLATFDGPGRAIQCSLALIASVRPLGIQIRAGLFTRVRSKWSKTTYAASPCTSLRGSRSWPSRTSAS